MKEAIESSKNTLKSSDSENQNKPTFQTASRPVRSSARKNISYNENPINKVSNSADKSNSKNDDGNDTRRRSTRATRNKTTSYAENFNNLIDDNEDEEATISSENEGSSDSDGAFMMM